MSFFIFSAKCSTLVCQKDIKKIVANLPYEIRRIEGGVLRCSHGEVVDVERVFVDVGCVGPDSYTSAGCQIATVASHGLHHKHPSLGASR